MYGHMNYLVELLANIVMNESITECDGKNMKYECCLLKSKERELTIDYETLVKLSAVREIRTPKIDIKSIYRTFPKYIPYKQIRGLIKEAKKSNAEIYIGGEFGIFGGSHLLNISDYKNPSYTVLSVNGIEYTTYTRSGEKWFRVPHTAESERMYFENRKKFEI